MPRFTRLSQHPALGRDARAAAHPRIGRFLSSFCAFLGCFAAARAADPELLHALREASASSPVLEAFVPGQPQFHTFRLNSEVVKHKGEYYSVVRLHAPAGPRRPLVLMFSDVGTVQEYELIRKAGDSPIRGNLRVIYPRLTDPDHDEKEPSPEQTLTLPRPWDLFELHILGVPEKMIQPDEEYLLWFRFEDRRPADILCAAVFLPPGTPLVEGALPKSLGLPEVPAR